VWCEFGGKVALSTAVWCEFLSHELSKAREARLRYQCDDHRANAEDQRCSGEVDAVEESWAGVNS